MNSINRELYKEIEIRSSGTQKEIAIDLLTQVNEDSASDERIKDDIRRKVEFAVREEEK